MSYVIVEDSELAKRNKSLLVGCGSGIAYNAVLPPVTFDDGTVVEPVTLQEAKDWLKIDIDDDDAAVLELITAARIVCENHANLSFIEREVTARIMNGLGGQQLPYGPVISITSVTLADGTDIYDADFSMDNAYGNIYTVVYTAGYATLPKNLKQAMKAQISWMNEHSSEASLNPIVKGLLNQVRSV